MTKLEAYKDNILQETINFGSDENVLLHDESVTSRKVNSVLKAAGSNRIFHRAMGHSTTQIGMDLTATSLTGADKLRQLCSNIGESSDLYDELRLYLHSDTRFFKIVKANVVTQFPRGKQIGIHPMKVTAICPSIFEFGTEHNETFEHDLIFQSIDFITFTAVDAGGDFTITPSEIDVSTMTRGTVSYIHKELDENVTGNFEVKGSFLTDSHTQGFLYLFGYGDTVDLIENSTSWVAIRFSNGSLNIETEDGTASNISTSTGTQYWWKFSRSGSVVTLNVYDDSIRTSEIASSPQTITQSDGFDSAFAISSESTIIPARNWDGHIFELETCTGLSATAIDLSSNTKLWVPALGAGNSTPDASGNGNTGTVFGTTKADTPLGLGRLFNGINEFVSVPYSATFNTPTFTAGAWVKLDDTAGLNRAIIARDDGVDRVWGLFVTTLGKVGFVVRNAGATAESASVGIVDDNHWHHIFATFDGTVLQTYIDGTADGNTTISGGVRTDLLTDLWIGRNFSSGNYMNGELQVPIFLNTALTTRQILSKYNDEKVLLSMVNDGNMPAVPRQIIATGVTETSLIDQAQLSFGTTQGFGEVDATGKSDYILQEFVPTKPHLTKVTLHKRPSTGTFIGTVTISIESKDNGCPSSTTLVSTTISNADWEALSSGLFFIELPYFLTVGTVYYIKAIASTNDNSNHPNISRSSGDTYTEGVGYRHNTTDGCVSLGADLNFKTFYAEHTKNVGLYGEDDIGNILQLGKESISHSFLIDDGNGLSLNAPGNFKGFTFQPIQTKLSKIMFRAKYVISSLIGNLRIRLYEWDTINNKWTGGALATSYLSAAVLSSLKTDFYVPFEYGIDDGNSLDTSKTYAIIFDDAHGGSSYWYISSKRYFIGLDDSDSGREVSSTDSGGTWAEDSTRKTIHKIFYPDTLSCKLLSDAIITINDNTSGTYSSVLTGTETVYGANEASGIFSISSAGLIQLKADGAYFIWKFTSPYLMKNIELIYRINPVNNGTEILISKDNISWEIITHIETDGIEDDVETTLNLSSDYNNISTLYIKYRNENSTSSYLKTVGINTADINTMGTPQIKIKPATDTIYQSHDELSSGRAIVQIKHNDTYAV